MNESREMIGRKAVEVFDSASAAEIWLHQPLSILGGKTPSEMTETEAGTEIVAQILAKISWGGAA